MTTYAAEVSPALQFQNIPCSASAWELLMGSLFAFVPVTIAPLRQRTVRELLAAVGLVFILVPILLHPTPFPGRTVFIPVFGAALLIWSNGGGRTITGTALSIRPVVFVGLISYSFYLWHWPFMAFNTYLALTPPSLSQRLVLVALGFLCAVVSWRYVETPFRKRQLGSSRKSIFAYTGIGLVALFGFGAFCVTTQGFPQRFSPEAQQLARAEMDRPFLKEITEADIKNDNLVRIGKIASDLKPAVLVWGDSHAMSAMPALDAFFKEKGLAGRAATHSSTAPILDWYQKTDLGLNEDAISYNKALLDYIAKKRVPDVILIAHWGRYAKSTEGSTTDFYDCLLLTVRKIVASGSRVWVMLDVPNHEIEVPRILSRSVVSHIDVAPFCAKPAAYDELGVGDPDILNKIKAAGGRILDPKPQFLDPTGRYYIIQSQGIPLYWDKHHLTVKGAEMMLIPLLRDSFLTKTR